jgi:hypothetical protein
MSSLVNWVDLIFVGPFLVLIGNGYFPNPTLIRMVGIGVILMNLIGLAQWSGLPMKPLSKENTIATLGQSKTEWKSKLDNQGYQKYPYEIFQLE